MAKIEALDNAIKAKGLTQKEIAARMKVSEQAVSGWVNGTIRPDDEHATKLAEMLEMDRSAIIGLYPKRWRGKKGTGLMMNEMDILQLDSIEKAVAITDKILDITKIKEHYSHSIYMLLSWLLPAVIGLTYWQKVDDKRNIYGVNAEYIFINLTDLMEADIRFDDGVSKNYLDYRFNKMELESYDFHEATKRTEYYSSILDYWYSFRKAMPDPSCSLYGELRVAIRDMYSQY